ncbi:cell wall elongation regulator TseB-like domain-containing protein [Aneurinibacillus tyrosinisolvens]|uniref:cell wall elongation regulator TseB-like domain-containing protein n=1 Tax=Aneurinibacillus tyrosinisolvens TaxID=1443435 RepID=UPI00069BD36C|nr:DUF5590 domain-containing protein [Aneurinibacillus tyrosinisolvens]
MKRWIIYVVSGLVLLALWASFDLYWHVRSQQRNVTAQGTELAHEKTQIQEIDEVDTFHGKEDYLVVQGRTGQGQKQIAWFKDGAVDVENTDRVVSKESVIQAIKKENPQTEFVHVIPGKTGNDKFWEVLFLDKEHRFNYYYFDMHTGRFIKSYRLLKATS